MDVDDPRMDDDDARIAAGAAVIMASGYDGCLCDWCCDRDGQAAAVRDAMLVAMGWRISSTDSQAVS